MTALAGAPARHTIGGLLGEGVTLLLVLLLLPVAILLLGLPFVLLVRIVLAIAERL